MILLFKIYMTWKSCWNYFQLQFSFKSIWWNDEVSVCVHVYNLSVIKIQKRNVSSILLNIHGRIELMFVRKRVWKKDCRYFFIWKFCKVYTRLSIGASQFTLYNLYDQIKGSLMVCSIKLMLKSFIQIQDDAEFQIYKFQFSV